MTVVDADALEGLWREAKPDAAGLVTAVVQHAQTGVVLMVGAMNREALARTLANRRVTFFSRSRQQLWEKGESSGHTLHLVDLRIDCDGDAVLVQAHPVGPTCHTGASSCFFREAHGEGLRADDGPAAVAGAELAALAEVFAVILARKAGVGATASGGRSYVRDLLAGGPKAIAAKIREEADELARALQSEADERVAAEAADLLFHAWVGLAARELSPRDVAAVLTARFGTSGHDEKAARRGAGSEPPPAKG